MGGRGLHRLRFVVPAAVLAVSLVVVVGSGAATKPIPKRGGTVVIGTDQEPSSLNVFLTGRDHFWGRQLASAVLAPAFKLQPDFSRRPYLVSGVRVTTRPFAVTYTIRRGANWSEPGVGTRPITSDDFLFTYETIVDPRSGFRGVSGYRDISRAERIRARVVRFTFARPFAGYKTLFSVVLPRHALSGLDFSNVWRDAIDNPKTGSPIASGGFYLERWERGREAVLRRNPQFWGHQAYLNQAVIRFLPHAQAATEQFVRGQVDVIYPQPASYLVVSRGGPRHYKLVVGKGASWEHISFNLGHRGRGDPNLRNRFVRQSILHGINRPALVNAVFSQTYIAPGNPVLQSFVIVSNSKYYKRHFARYPYDPTKARALLERGGCTRGADFIYVCDGRRLSLRAAWAPGPRSRLLAFEITQAFLKQVGIEILAPPTPACVCTDTRRQDGDYDLLFSASVDTGDYSSWHDVYGCRDDEKGLAPENLQGYCNRVVDRNLRLARSETNEAKQAKLVNAAIQQMAEDAIGVPLFQWPTQLLHRTALHGLRENPTPEGPVWNLEHWWRTDA